MAEKRLDELILKSTALGRLSDEAAGRLEREKALRGVLPADFRAAVTHASLDGNGTLALTTPSAAWASRLRYGERELCRRYVAAGFDVTGLKVRVRPSADEAAPQ
ncbi:MAG: DciA family protein [Pseudomonadota bacterium]